MLNFFSDANYFIISPVGAMVCNSSRFSAMPRASAGACWTSQVSQQLRIELSEEIMAIFLEPEIQSYALQWLIVSFQDSTIREVCFRSYSGSELWRGEEGKGFRV